MTVRVTNSARENLALTLGGRQLCDRLQKTGLPKRQGWSPQTGVPRAREPASPSLRFLMRLASRRGSSKPTRPPGK